jgi:tRNA threonylcarbamoyladenosine biosynthesis protein TsaB
MRILALETSSSSGAVAVLEDEDLLGKTSLSSHQRTAQWLVPVIVKQLAQVGWRPQNVQLYAVTQGPGSFTGLRVGVTTAKTLAYAVGAEVMGVNTLETIAVQAFHDSRFFLCGPSAYTAQTVCAVVDAQRRQLFSARFRQSPNGATVAVEPTQVVARERWLAQLQAGEVASGPGLQGVLGDLTAGVAVVEQRLWAPQPETVGRIARRHFQAGRRDNLWRLAPRYYRASAAEEKLNNGNP